MIAGEASHHGSVPHQATQGQVQHGRRQGRPAPSSPAQSQEGPQTVRPSADSGARPDSAAYKAKVTCNALAVLQSGAQSVPLSLATALVAATHCY